MSLHRVSLVIREAVAGVMRVEHPHHRVALDLRKDGGGSDAGGFGVAFDDRLLRDVNFLQLLRVDQQMLRRLTQSLDRTLHRLDARPIDVDRVNLFDLDERDTPTLGLFLDLLREFFASRGVKPFRVINSDYPRAGFKNHGGSGDRPGERAHAGLVHACHRTMAAFPERRLEAKHFAKALSFGPVFEASSID
ncbi:hypothetical protein ABIF63_001358 [Bradyrhizobium japonicum]|uniref:Uncharacterized protein n=1 Tax=Bradyrhizobium japonicum TaxID=375 RepID=A0ABV2RLW5_BRAJP